VLGVVGVVVVVVGVDGTGGGTACVWVCGGSVVDGGGAVGTLTVADLLLEPQALSASVSAATASKEPRLVNMARTVAAATRVGQLPSGSR